MGQRHGSSKGLVFVRWVCHGIACKCRVAFTDMISQRERIAFSLRRWGQKQTDLRNGRTNRRLGDPQAYF